ncbi:hypothetical protein DKM19_46000 [Streptosporangium sp. 'caverna']|nr:hypothetical protein DKM19_46000 [Streptosporangium sp. 'caverna']
MAWLVRSVSADRAPALAITDSLPHLGVDDFGMAYLRLSPSVPIHRKPGDLDSCLRTARTIVRYGE